MLSARPRTRLLGVLSVFACACASSPTAAAAVPIAVQLRVEGSSATLFEGVVSTEAIANPPGLSTTSSGGAHPCDVKDNGMNEGFVPAAGTPTTALYNAATAAGLSFDAKWFSSFNDFLVTRVGSDTNQEVSPFASWGYAVNYATAHVGGCQFQLAPGSEVLWAYNYEHLPHLLDLTGPVSANAGTPFTLHVVDGQNGQPIAGAQIGELASGVTTALPAGATDASGNATITLARAGTTKLKATQPESVRSNGLVVCIHNGNDGTCGTSVVSQGATATGQAQPTAPTKALAPEMALVVGIKNAHVYPRRHAPRVLAAVVQVPAGGTLHDVRIRLERRHHGRCFNFSGQRAAFVRARRCARARFFSVGASTSFSYLLPTRLAPGRYSFAVEAIDNAGHATQLIAGVSQVVFRVR